MVLRGVVVEGKKLGRKLGFPTANFLISESVAVENGVYRSCVVIDGVEYKAATNIGNNPTIGVESRRAESYIIDFDGDLYGRTIEIKLCEKIRNELKFNNIEALRAQIIKDVSMIKDVEK
ncbi:MAG: riboflavin kinase [Rikenellaceae bacterium]